MQDTAAQVAAMTADLSRLAEAVLPQEDEQQGHGRQRQGNKGLRQQLLESWNGKVGVSIAWSSAIIHRTWPLHGFIAALQII